MIWIWIAAAVIISLIGCNKRIPWYHYIWMLLPIEMYGITIAGATFKPYMIFGILFFLGFISKRDNLKLPVGIGLVAMALLVSDLLNGLILASIMQHLMFLLIIFIAYSYLRLQGNKIELDYIADVTIATTVGYGLVFFAASILFSASITFDGIYTTDRYSPGMIMRFLSTGGISSTRLRGFCIDPNSVFTTLIPGAVFSLANILYLGREKIKVTILFLAYAVHS
jgi:hypothetical protein